MKNRALGPNRGSEPSEFAEAHCVWHVLLCLTCTVRSATNKCPLNMRGNMRNALSERICLKK